MSRSVNDMYKAIGLDMRVKAISNWIKGIPASHDKATAYQTQMPLQSLLLHAGFLVWSLCDLKI